MLGALKYVATGYTFDTLDKLTCVAGEIHCVFIRCIFAGWKRHAAKEYIKLFESNEEICYVMGMHERNRHPVYISSVHYANIV